MPKVDNTKPKRRCLKCTKMFPSSSKTNRICKECKMANSEHSVTCEGVLNL